MNISSFAAIGIHIYYLYPLILNLRVSIEQQTLRLLTNFCNCIGKNDLNEVIK